MRVAPGRDRSASWNPAQSVQISPTEYEAQVAAWLAKAGPKLENFRVSHLAHLPGASGEYVLDAVAEFTVFGEARITVLIECKRHAEPVKREAVIVLEGKLRDVGAHKGMIFSTSGFQRGAIEYAARHGIATVTFIDGDLLYETRALGPRPKPPVWANLPRFAGWFFTEEDGVLRSSTLYAEQLQPLAAWLAADDPHLGRIINEQAQQR